MYVETLKVYVEGRWGVYEVDKGHIRSTEHKRRSLYALEIFGREHSVKRQKCRFRQHKKG